MTWTAIAAAIAIAIAAIVWLVRARAKRWPAIVALVVAGAIAFVMTNAPRALIVRDAASGLEVETVRVLGTPDGAGADCRPKGTWVVNRSGRTVRVERVVYGHELIRGPAEPAQQVTPGTACSTHDIDYIGPDNPPPARVPLGGDEARLQSGTRAWLTW
jgi:hypothetical protein